MIEVEITHHGRRTDSKHIGCCGCHGNTLRLRRRNISQCKRSLRRRSCSRPCAGKRPVRIWTLNLFTYKHVKRDHDKCPRGTGDVPYICIAWTVCVFVCARVGATELKRLDSSESGRFVFAAVTHNIMIDIDKRWMNPAVYTNQLQIDLLYAKSTPRVYVWFRVV